MDKLNFTKVSQVVEGGNLSPRAIQDLADSKLLYLFMKATTDTMKLPHEGYLVRNQDLDKVPESTRNLINGPWSAYMDNEIVRPFREKIAAVQQQMTNEISLLKKHIHVIESYLQCMCCQIEAGTRVSSPCGHRFCAQCCKKLFGGSGGLCPICKVSCERVVPTGGEPPQLLNSPRAVL